MDKGCTEYLSGAALFICHRSSDPIVGKKCERCRLSGLCCSLSVADGLKKKDYDYFRVKKEPVTAAIPAAKKTRGKTKLNKLEVDIRGQSKR